MPAKQEPKHHNIGSMISEKQFEAMRITAIAINDILIEMPAHRDHGERCPFSNVELMQELSDAAWVLANLMQTFLVNNREKQESTKQVIDIRSARPN